MSVDFWDVIVVGAGPAGLNAALVAIDAASEGAEAAIAIDTALFKEQLP